MRKRRSPFLAHFLPALCVLPLAWLWFVLINDLRVEWTVNPQYNYGWAVPFLCLFLVWERSQKSEVRSQKSEGGVSAGGKFQHSAFQRFSFQLLFVVCAFLYAPTRLIEEANPDWRLVSWALALEVVGLTLIFIHLASGASRLPPSAFRLPPSDFVFPICFFLVAVPWPSPIEMPLIQGLTRADTVCTTELLGWLGIPAMPHGNVIEVATGMVGIDEACSGIRSFQATLMISLFLGEIYLLGAWHRMFCVFAGFALSFVFNLSRMSLLVWVAARKGVAAIAAWHDPAGVTILIACFFSLWGLAVFLKNRQQKGESRDSSGKAETRKTETLKPETGNPSSVLRPLAVGLIAWIVLTEFSVEGWYRWHEVRVPAAVQWTVAWPVSEPAFTELALPERTRQILRYDEGRSAAWAADGSKWQAVFLRWRPGRTAIHLAQNHTPEVCMTAAGHTLNAISPQEWFEVNDLRMPFLAYEVTDAARPLFVFYCLWDDRPTSGANVTACASMV
jgi:exosortase